jgi:serine/threonine-protein kinase RsbW
MEAQALKFNSKPENIHIVEKFVDTVFDELNISRDYYGIIVTSLTEAVENAMKHGNNNNPDKFVHIVFESKPEGLAFSVRDEGNGFDFNRIPDPTDVNEDGSFFEGKGIFKIKNLADKVIFSDNGRCIETIFNVPGVNHQIAARRMQTLKSFFKEKHKTVYNEGTI